MVALEIYRRTTIGACLSEALDAMVISGRLAPELAVRIQLQFDESISAAMEQQVTNKVFFKGHLHTYRYIDHVWTFILRDATFSNDDISENIAKLKIVAVDSKLGKPDAEEQQ